MKRLYYIMLLIILQPALSFSQAKVDASEIIAKINQGQPVSYSNTLISGTLDLTRLGNRKKKRDQEKGENNASVFVSTVTSPIIFVNCSFEGPVLGYYNPDNEIAAVFTKKNEIYNTNFDKKVLFEDCSFKKEVAFKYSEFLGAVSFRACRFEGETTFKFSKFAIGPDFSKTIFDDIADFKYVKFPGKSLFAAALFNGEADFKYAEFKNGADFSKATFKGLANFKYTKFNSPLSINSASFKGEEDFKYTRLDGHKYQPVN